MNKPTNSWGFSRSELRKLRSLKNPYGIQRLLDDMPYHLEDTAWSPRRVLRENTSHCYEGALFAAAALRMNGYPPLIWDLEAEHDTDHVIAIYKVDGCWGAVAKSNFTGCRFREPVHRSLRELAISYFNIYHNLRGERTMRTFYARFFQQQYKRSCIPDGPKVGTVSLSPRGDWRMPSDADPAEWLKWGET